jgi:hypothetical protein
MRSVLGLLVVAAIVLLSYKFYFSKMQAAGAGANPVQTVDLVGVKNDLIAIGQAERMYQAQHSSYASLDELVSSGMMTIRKGRDGYTYDVDASADSFTVTAHCPAGAQDTCVDYSMDQSMQPHPIR